MWSEFVSSYVAGALGVLVSSVPQPALKEVFFVTSYGTSPALEVLALYEDGEVWCVGGERCDPLRPRRADALPRTAKLAVAAEHICALSFEGMLRCREDDTFLVHPKKQRTVYARGGDNIYSEDVDGYIYFHNFNLTKFNSESEIKFKGYIDNTKGFAHIKRKQAININHTMSCEAHYGRYSLWVDFPETQGGPLVLVESHKQSCWVRDGRMDCGGGPTIAVGVEDAAVADEFGCVRLTQGRLSCWNHDTEQREHIQTRVMLGARRFEALAGSDRLICGQEGGEAWCWGDDLMPWRLSTRRDLVALRGAATHVCGVFSNGDQICVMHNERWEIAGRRGAPSLAPLYNALYPVLRARIAAGLWGSMIRSADHQPPELGGE